jgi:glutathione S-transferase
VLSSDCYTIRLLLALLGLSYERHAVDMYPGTGSAPVLEMDGARLDDVGTILIALATEHGAHWLPAEADAARWLRFAATDQRPLIEARHVSMLGQPGDLVALNEQARLVLRAIDDHLTLQAMAGHDWLVDDAPTIADIAVFPAVMLSHDSGLGHEDFPAINLWQRRVRKLPGFVGMPGIPDYF